jgi:hypothetical protein
MRYLSPKRNIAFLIPFSLFLFQNHSLLGQTYEKTTKQTYLDSIIQLLPVLSPQDPISIWLLTLPLDSLPDIASLSDDQVLRYTYQLADKAVSLENDINFKARKTLDEQTQLEQVYKLAKKEGVADKNELDSLKSALKIIKSNAHKILTNQKAAKKVSSYALETTKLEVQNMRKAIPTLREKVVGLAKMSQEKTDFLVPFEVKDDKNAQVKTKKVKSKKVKKEKIATPEAEIASETKVDTIPNIGDIDQKRTKNAINTTLVPEKKLKPYDIKEDVMLNPPIASCVFTLNKTDEFSGKVLKELKYEEAFRFTNNYMKTHLDDKPHIVCESNLSTLGELVLVNLKVTINELNALKSFGGVSKKGLCTLKLINGNVLNLESVRDDEGILDEVGGFCVFNMQFATNKAALKILQKSELDKIRISWKRGYEEYEIYNVDIFKRQANCLLGE